MKKGPRALFHGWRTVVSVDPPKAAQIYLVNDGSAALAVFVDAPVHSRFGLHSGVLAAH